MRSVIAEKIQAKDMKKISRNDPCPCGKGKKYKHCCGLQGVHAERTATANTSISKAMQAAVEHHQAGRLQQAEAIYRQILRVAPNHPDALHLLGLIAHQTGNNEIAVELISKAISVNPSSQMFFNLGIALRSQGKLDTAIDSYRKALSLKPDYAEAHSNLGVALQEQGKLEEALESCQRALLLKPGFANAHFNLANVLKDQGKLEAATDSYRKALSFKPDFADACHNLGIALQDQGKLDEAIEIYRKTISIIPDSTNAYHGLGNALKDQGRFDEAVDSYRKALALKPEYAEALINIGNILKDQGKLDEAIEIYHKALLIKPECVEANINLGNVFFDQGRLSVGLAYYSKALEIKPDNAEAYSNKLFLYGYHASIESHEYLSIARGWELACIPEQDRQAARHRVFRHPPLAGRRLRVGYVSGDYRHHPVSFNIEPIFAHHDRTRIELFAYSTNGMRDAVTERLQALVEHWIPVMGISYAAIRDRIEADGIDVLIDLSGHTEHNRMDVFARRAAPVQAYYLGYFASTGLTEMDYLIGDEILTPPETDSHFSEQVWRLPRIWQVYNGKADAPVPDWHPAQDGTLWVGSFNNLAKLTPATLALWAKVLHALPEGRLLLKTKGLADVANRQRTLDAMAGHGISPDRIELQDGSSTPGWREHMAYYDRLDIALDPVGGMGGGITTCDALWMGTPVITLAGDRYASRVTATILNSIGHPEWIARSEAEYIDKVVALARDVDQRQAFRPGQREQMASSPLCDARGLTMLLENAYFEMFERWKLQSNGHKNP